MKIKLSMNILLQMIVSNIVFYFGVVEQIQWVGNLGIFYVWLMLISAISVYVGNTEILLQTYRDGKHLPLWVDYVVFIYRVVLFIGYGWWWTGIIVTIVSLIDFVARKESKETPANPVINMKLVLDIVYNYMTKPKNERPEYSYVISIINDARDALNPKDKK